jgi:dTDP-4-dehydrorhamnose reductase
LKRLLIVGGDSKIGVKLRYYFHNIYELWFTSRNTSIVDNFDNSIYLNLDDDPNKWILPNTHYDYILLLASITSINLCNENPISTKIINVNRTLVLIRKLSEKGTIIFFSSNEVLLGSLSKNSWNRLPITEYGRQKSVVEEVILRDYKKIIIIRLSKIYNNKDKLFCNWIKDLKNAKKIYPFKDLYVSLISLESVANLINYIIKQTSTPQIIQLSGSKDFSYSKIALYISHLIKADKSLVCPISGKGLVDDKRLSKKTSLVNTYDPLLFGPIDLKVLSNIK